LTEKKRTMSDHKTQLQLRPIIYWLYNWNQFRRELDTSHNISRLLHIQFQLLAEGKQVCTSDRQLAILVDMFALVSTLLHFVDIVESKKCLT
jgi:hypothetical protein